MEGSIPLSPTNKNSIDMIPVIEKLGLTDEQVLLVVLQWYQGYNSLCPEIFQNEEGDDLEEVIESQIDWNSDFLKSKDLN